MNLICHRPVFSFLCTFASRCEKQLYSHKTDLVSRFAQLADLHLVARKQTQRVFKIGVTTMKRLTPMWFSWTLGLCLSGILVLGSLSVCATHAAGPADGADIEQDKPYSVEI